MEITIAAVISGLALVVTIGWNLHNHRRTTVATKLARFERHVAVPLNQLLLDLDDAADLAAVLADPKSSPLESRKRQVSEELYRRVLMLQKRLVRLLPLADSSNSSDYTDWINILDDNADDAVTDAIAEALEADNQTDFDKYLGEASQHLVALARELRARLERES